jgi:hypothetical protein
VLRLRGNANALNRAALQNETRLEKAQRQTLEGAAPLIPAPELPSTDPPTSSETQDLVDFVRAAWKAEKAASAVAQPAVALSRQQRRFADRQAEKRRQRELAQARLAQRAAQLGTAHARRAAASA